MEIELFNCLKKKYLFLIKKVSAHNREFAKVRYDILCVFLRLFPPNILYIYVCVCIYTHTHTYTHTPHRYKLCPAFLQLALYNENFPI